MTLIDPAYPQEDAARRPFFTPQQADRALVLIRRIVSDVTGLYAHLLDLQETVEAADGVGNAPGAAARDDLVRTAERLHDCLEELDELGIELTDWDRGVVDFPCIAGGREVRLCWGQGERSICHWHEVHECGGVRYSLETLPACEPAEALR